MPQPPLPHDRDELAQEFEPHTHLLSPAATRRNRTTAYTAAEATTRNTMMLSIMMTIRQCSRHTPCAVSVSAHGVCLLHFL